MPLHSMHIMHACEDVNWAHPVPYAGVSREL